MQEMAAYAQSSKVDVLKKITHAVSQYADMKKKHNSIFFVSFTSLSF